jgi:hypothetical protein
MARRRRRFDPILPHDDGTPLRRALGEAAEAIDTVIREWIALDELADALRLATITFLRDGRVAIVVFDQAARDVTSVREASRAAALHAALRVNASLASAYQERWAPPRTILAACHAVARVIAVLHGTGASEDAVSRWN